MTRISQPGQSHTYARSTKITTFAMMAIRVPGFLHLNAHRLIIPLQPRMRTEGYRRKINYVFHFQKFSYVAHVN